jgi:hypothetical protein
MKAANRSTVKAKARPSTEWQHENNARCLWEIRGPSYLVPWITCYAKPGEGGVWIVMTYRDGTYTVLKEVEYGAPADPTLSLGVLGPLP